MLEQCGKLIDGAKALGLPVLATEQYPTGLGPTVGPIRERLEDDVPIVEKLKFSAFVEDIREQLAELGRRTVLLCGIEAHVCVLQTALDLAAAGYVTAVAGDAIGSRRPVDGDLALRRLTEPEIVPVSVEMALLELAHEAGTDRFKAVLPIIK